jgi:hypothetical protein
MKRTKTILAKTILLTIITIFLVTNLYAQEKVWEWESSIDVGVSPQKLIYDAENDIMHAFNAGIDVDGDGEFNPETDHLPSWYIIRNVDDMYESMLVNEFAFDSFSTESSFTVDYKTRVLYISFKDNVKAYSFDTYEELDPEVTDFPVNNVFANEAHLLLTVFEGLGSSVSVYNPIAKISYATIETEGYSVASVSYMHESGNMGIGTIGFDIEGEGYLMYGTFEHMNVPEMEKITLGGLPTHVIVHENYLIITVSDLNYIGVFDVNTETLTKHYTGNYAFYSPREVSVYGENIYVATWAGDIRVINLLTGNLVEILDGGYPIEGITFSANEMFTFEYLVAEEEYITQSIDIYVKQDAEQEFEMVGFEVGKAPLHISYDPDNNNIYVFCQGVDVNFNQEYEPNLGDELPSWWVLIYEELQGGNYFYRAQQVAEFDFWDFSLPFRPTYDYENRLVYLPLAAGLASMDLDDFTPVDYNVTDFPVRSAFQTDGHLILSTNPVDGEPGRVLVYNPTMRRTLSSVEAGVNMLDAVAFYTSEGQMGMAAISTGEFGSEDSKLHYAYIEHMVDPVFKTIDLGIAANHIYVYQNLLVITVNQSHKILVFDTDTEEFTVHYTGTYGWDGPRESKLVPEFGMILTSTYAGDIRMFEGFTGNMESILPPKVGKIEGFDFIIHPVYEIVIGITAPFDANYTVQNMVYLLGEGFPTSVVEYPERDIQRVSVYPNPVSDIFNIQLEYAQEYSAESQVQIVTIQGSKVAEFTLSAGITHLELSANDLGLASGSYLVRIQSGNRFYDVPFVVAK